MSGKRLSKRQARELEELEALQKQAGSVRAAESSAQGALAAQDEDQDDAVSPSQGKRQQPVSAFAALTLSDAEEDDSDEQAEGTSEITAAPVPSSSKSKKKKQKRKKQHQVPGDDAQASGSPARTPGPSRGGKAKAGTTPDKTAAKGVDDMSMDELDRLLAEQQNAAASAADPETAEQAPSVSEYSQLSKLRSLLSCSAQNFDPFVELKRSFGAAAVKAYENEARGEGGRNARTRGAAHNPNMRLRCVLVQPKPEWPPISQTFTGMSMEDEVRPSGRVCSWIHSRAYKEAQYNFLEAVRSYDPNTLYTLLRLYPWHIDTLLQLSEVLRHQGDLGQAGDFVCRALFALERCANPSFIASLTSSSGPAQVDFSRVENRGFYLAAHRHVNYLGRRGTWRTSLEWCKLLLAMGGPEDPHAILLWIDFLAIKSNSHCWMLQLDEALSQVQDLKWAVGWQYARALALRAVEREDKDETHAKSDAALQSAIEMHPMAVPILLRKLGVDNPIDDPALRIAESWADTHGSDAYAHLLSHLYAARSDSLWKDHDHQGWLVETFKRVWPIKKHTSPDAPTASMLTGIYRHVIVSDIPDALRQQLISLMPHELTSQSELLNASDPFAPRGTHFDDRYFREIHMRNLRESQGSQVADITDAIGGWVDRMNEREPTEEEGRGFMERFQAVLGPRDERGTPEEQLERALQDQEGLLNRFMAFFRAEAREGGPAGGQ